MRSYLLNLQKKISISSSPGCIATFGDTNKRVYHTFRGQCTHRLKVKKNTLNFKYELRITNVFFLYKRLTCNFPKQLSKRAGSYWLLCDFSSSRFGYSFTRSCSPAGAACLALCICVKQIKKIF